MGHSVVHMTEALAVNSLSLVYQCQYITTFVMIMDLQTMQWYMQSLPTAILFYSTIMLSMPRLMLPASNMALLARHILSALQLYGEISGMPDQTQYNWYGLYW